MRTLCLGNHTNDTEVKTRNLARSADAMCFGLLSDLHGTANEDYIGFPGYYYSSIYDIEYGKLLEFGKYFGEIIILNQPKEDYSHPDAFYKTIKLANELKAVTKVVFLDTSYDTSITFFEELVKTNKSFCIFPFIELLTNQRTDGHTTVCCRSTTPITHISEITNWQTNEKYKDIRDKMINGTLVTEHCSFCYKLENKNILSPREQETVEWANRLNLTSLDDLNNIAHPAYYEVHPSNVCNLQCRMCGPTSSHLIGQEYKKINLISEMPPTTRSDFSIIDFTNLKKLYVAGGEPTATIEFYEFLDYCIENKRTNFEFLVNTNATKLSNRFKKQLKHFSNLQFVVSLDGLGPLNYYIRWPSNWDTIIDNMHYLRKNNHPIVTNTTVSIYNVLGLYDLLKFFDDNFPGMLVHCLTCDSPGDILSGFIFPDPKLAVEKLLPIQELNCYKNDRLLKSFIDSIITNYQSTSTIDLEKLKLFFEFNDKLDLSRNIKLVNYIPELEQARKLIL